MMRSAVVGALLLLVAACGLGQDPGSTYTPAPKPESARDCREIWTDGDQLPETYARCWDGRTDHPESSVACVDGEQLTVYDGRLLGRWRGPTCQEASSDLWSDSAFEEVLAECLPDGSGYVDDFRRSDRMLEADVAPTGQRYIVGGNPRESDQQRALRPPGHPWTRPHSLRRPPGTDKGDKRLMGVHSHRPDEDVWAERCDRHHVHVVRRWLHPARCLLGGVAATPWQTVATLSSSPAPSSTRIRCWPPVRCRRVTRVGAPPTACRCDALVETRWCSPCLTEGRRRSPTRGSASTGETSLDISCVGRRSTDGGAQFHVRHRDVGPRD